MGVTIGLIAGALLVRSLTDDFPAPNQFDTADSLDSDVWANIEWGESGEWQWFENADPGFGVDLPGTAVVNTIALASPSPGIALEAATIRSERQAFLVIWADVSGPVDLAGAVAGAAVDNGGAILRQEPTLLAGMEGRRATIDTGGLILVTVFAGDGINMYQLLIAAESAADEDLDRMIESFALVP